MRHVNYGVVSREAIGIYKMKIELNTHGPGQTQYAWTIRCGSRGKILWGRKFVAETFDFSLAPKIALNY